MYLWYKKARHHGYVWRCRESTAQNGQGVERSVKNGSWFGNCRLDIPDILFLTYMWCYNGTNELIMQDLFISSKTAVDCRKYCREVCVELCARDSEVIVGLYAIVGTQSTSGGGSTKERIL